MFCMGCSSHACGHCGRCGCAAGMVAARKEERDRIVAQLREWADYADGVGDVHQSHHLRYAADRIARGDP